MKEIEILVAVFDAKDKVLEALSSFDYKGAKTVVDAYFYDPQKKQFQPQDGLRLVECLRLRKKDGQAYVTYKNDKFDDVGTWLYSDEVETKVADFNKMTEIFKSIGLKELITIDNTKHTYIKNNYEIVLEEVKDLGLFLEVELMLEDDGVDVMVEKQKIQKFIDDLAIQVSDELNMGKPEMMLRKKTEQKG